MAGVAADNCMIGGGDDESDVNLAAQSRWPGDITLAAGGGGAGDAAIAWTLMANSAILAFAALVLALLASSSAMRRRAPAAPRAPSCWPPPG